MRYTRIAFRLCLLCCLSSLVTAFFVSPARATTLVVSNNNDVVNGDTSCPQALISNPGSDGISLREAIRAVNGSCPGPHTITFAAALAGKTIAPTTAAGCCYIITQDNVTISGVLGADGQPAVTIDASNMFILFSVSASGFTLSSLRIIGLQAGSPGDKTGVFVRPASAEASNKLQISNIVIEGNVFINNPGTTAGIAVVLGTASATGTLMSNVTIASNSFTHFKENTDAVKIQAGGSNNIVEDVLILGNVFADISFPVEVIPNFTSNKIVRTRIIANSFSSNAQVVNLNIIGFDNQSPTTGNVIDDTLIESNVFRANVGPVIVLIAGLTEPSGSLNTKGNTITNTRIVNNLIADNTVDGTVQAFGGLRGSTNNSINGVNIINNTLANNSTCGSGFCEGAISVADNLEYSTGNKVSGVSVLNTILWKNTIDFKGVDPSQVFNSITATSGFAGVNGNINANPLFVNATGGDYHLQSGSPAIGKGSSSGAPSDDLECKVRPSPPAIGAYEPGNNPGCVYVYPISVSRRGTGTVTSSPSGIDCGATCSANFWAGTQVTLTANPAAAWGLSGWGGACSGIGGCSVTMNANASVSASFTTLFTATQAPVVTSPADIPVLPPASIAPIPQPSAAY
jgi:hypothetical protein